MSVVMQFEIMCRGDSRGMVVIVVTRTPFELKNNYL